MPRFFFDVDAEPPDRVGVDLPDSSLVRSEAIRAAGEMLRDINGALDGEWLMTVRDEGGHVVLELRFSAIGPTAS